MAMEAAICVCCMGGGGCLSGMSRAIWIDASTSMQQAPHRQSKCSWTPRLEAMTCQGAAAADNRYASELRLQLINPTASTTLQAEHAQQDASSRGDDLNGELQRRIKEAAVLRVQLDASSTKAVAMESQLKESVAVSDGRS